MADGVLSGFLITYLPFTEKGSLDRSHVAFRGGSSDPGPCTSRAWRLGSWHSLFKRWVGLRPAETANSCMYTCSLGNFDVIRNGLADASSLGVLWSVA